MPKKWQYRIYPDLQRFAPAEQDDALRKAKDIALDGFEIMGITISIALVLYVTRYSSADIEPAQRMMARILHMVVIVAPLVVLSCIPFFIRRARRGLAAQLKDRQSATTEQK